MRRSHLSGEGDRSRLLCHPQGRENGRIRGGQRIQQCQGYDRKWRAYRESFLADLANLYCKGYPVKGSCLKTSTEVDHIVPVKGHQDPLFWEPTNHQGLCHDCHSRKTVDDGRWKGRTVSAGT